jgi:hypothetical protein
MINSKQFKNGLLIDQISESIDYFTQLKKRVSKKSMVYKGSGNDIEYRTHLIIAELAARQLDKFHETDLEVISANGAHLVEDVINNESQQNVGLQYIIFNKPEVVEYQVKLDSVNAAINVLTDYEQVMTALKIWK